MTRLDNLVAAQAAARALNKLDADQSRPIDPFDAINKLGLELQFRPLRDLLGVILPGDNPGVLINSARPASVQRYTAAHEIGHWYLDQNELAIDTAEEVEGMPRHQRERRAQIFASHFLMPLGLLHPTTARYGVYKGSAITPIQAYQIARDMHVSYKAIVYQLLNARFIDTSTRNTLLQVQPAALKTELTNGRRPHNARGDVWTTNAEPETASLEVFVGDEVVLGLRERPSTGHRWVESGSRSQPQAVRPAPSAFGSKGAFTAMKNTHINVIALRPEHVVDSVLSMIADGVDASSSIPGQPTRVGAEATRRMAYSATRPGTSVLDLHYRRPFSASDPIDYVQIRARVRALPEVEERQRRLRQFALEEQRLGDGASS